MTFNRGKLFVKKWLGKQRKNFDNFSTDSDERKVLWPFLKAVCLTFAKDPIQVHDQLWGRPKVRQMSVSVVARDLGDLQWRAKRLEPWSGTAANLCTRRSRAGTFQFLLSGTVWKAGYFGGRFSRNGKSVVRGQVRSGTLSFYLILLSFSQKKPPEFLKFYEKMLQFWLESLRFCPFLALATCESNRVVSLSFSYFGTYLEFD